MSKELKQLIREAINQLGSNGNSDDLMLAIQLHNEFNKCTRGKR